MTSAASFSSPSCFLCRCVIKCKKGTLTGNSCLFVGFLLFLISLNASVDAVPYRSKSKDKEGPQTMYDQKQTGDYNIQLHLKDFQIIALLGDDALGDYDYNYDYADFTIKPAASSTTTTSKPSTPNQSSSTALSNISQTSNISPLEVASKPTSSIVNNSHPYPIEVVVTSTKKTMETKIPASKDGENSTQINKDFISESSSNELVNLSSITPPALSEDSSDLPTATPLTLKASSLTPETMTPGKIKVQILEAPAPTVETAPVVVGIVPGEDVHGEGSSGILQGELGSYRKCSSGFTRDKKGRCRRVRRPGAVSSHQLPFPFGRIATNIANRLRLSDHQDNSADNALSKKI